MVDILKGAKVSKGPGLKKGATLSAEDLQELSLDDMLSIEQLMIQLMIKLKILKKL